MSPIEDKAVFSRRSLRSVGPAGLIFFAFWIFIPPLAGQASSATPSPIPTPVLNRLRFQREILDLKIQAIRQPASASSIRARLARIYLKSGEPDKAVNLYRYAIIFDPPRADSYHRQIARLYRQQGRDEEAEEELRRAAASAPATEAERRRRQLTEWEAQGRDDLLLQQYRFLYWTKARSGDQYLRNIARLLSGKGEGEEAGRYYRLLIADYRKRIDERPSAAINYRLRIAGIYEEMEEPEAAAEEYRRAVEIEGEEGEQSADQRGRLLSLTGRGPAGDRPLPGGANPAGG